MASSAQYDTMRSSHRWPPLAPFATDLHQCRLFTLLVDGVGEQLTTIPRFQARAANENRPFQTSKLMFTPRSNAMPLSRERRRPVIQGV